MNTAYKVQLSLKFLQDSQVTHKIKIENGASKWVKGCQERETFSESNTERTCIVAVFWSHKGEGRVALQDRPGCRHVVLQIVQGSSDRPCSEDTLRPTSALLCH